MRPRNSIHDPQMQVDVDVAVIGAGISGLVAAHRLRRSGISVLVLEKSHRPGGVIESFKTDGYLIEKGPNSIRGTQEFLDLITDLEIRGELITGDPGLPAYTYSRRGLQPVPMSLLSALRTDIISRRGKLRCLWEPFRRSSDALDESIASFIRRRLGTEVLEELVSPFISGIYAGDPERLSLEACFPALARLERQSGSITGGMLRKLMDSRRAPRQSASAPLRQYRLCSFREGLSTLTDTLAKRLDGALRCGVTVDTLRIERAAENDVVFRIETSSAAGKQLMSARSVIIATPAPAAASLLRTVAPAITGHLGRIPYNSLVSVPVGCDQQGLPELRGFGFLATRAAGLRTLGSIWNSSAFADRAKSGYFLTTSFIGGTNDPDAVALSDWALRENVSRDLRRVFGGDFRIEALPLTRYPTAIPQYELGHSALAAQIELEASRIPGLWLAGNYLGGVSVGDCIRNALGVAENVEKRFAEEHTSRSSGYLSGQRRLPSIGKPDLQR